MAPRRPPLGGSPCPLLVVSPHLDDAVLSCGRLLAATPGAMVVTVFAGSKADWSEVAPWDRSCGFKPGHDVMAARRIEDRRALKVLDATPYWLDGLDREYRGGSPDVETLRRDLTEALVAVQPAQVAVPLGLYHEDHRWASDIATDAAARSDRTDCLVYADWYHITKPELVAQRAATLAARYGQLSERRVRQGAEWAKRRSIWRYRSQRRGLSRNVHRWGSRIEERYWCLALSA